METLLEDIRSNKTLDSVKRFKEIILDCAKNIKSNDATFKISTLPEVSDKLSSLMTSYIDTIQHLESSQRAFMQLYEEVSIIEAEHNEDEFISIGEFEEKFRQKLEQENETVTEEAEAQVNLDSIIRPLRPAPLQDEEIVVEAPARQVPKDPITKRDIKVAVKSTTCNHIYDKGSIDTYFAQKEKSKVRVQCPVAGCQNRNMKKNEIILDEETNKLIESLYLQ